MAGASLLAALCAASTRTFAAPSPCAVDISQAVDLESKFEQAARGVRTCVRTGGEPRAVGRRLLTRISSLRDEADYDRRRAWSGLSARQERIYGERLAFILQDAAAAR